MESIQRPSIRLRSGQAAPKAGPDRLLPRQLMNNDVSSGFPTREAVLPILAGKLPCTGQPSLEEANSVASLSPWHVPATALRLPVSHSRSSLSLRYDAAQDRTAKIVHTAIASIQRNSSISEIPFGFLEVRLAVSVQVIMWRRCLA